MGGWESPELCSIIAQIGDGEEDTNDEDIERNIEIFFHVISIQHIEKTSCLRLVIWTLSSDTKTSAAMLSVHNYTQTVPFEPLLNILQCTPLGASSWCFVCLTGQVNFCRMRLISKLATA